MTKSNTRSLLILLLLAALPLFVDSFDININVNLFGKLHVYIINNLGPGPLNDLTVHCKSKDRDLGIQKLSNGQEFTWKFRENLWGTTLYWCNFYWGNGKQGSAQVFDAGEYKLKEPMEFYYEVRHDGLYWSKARGGVYTAKSLWSQ